MSNESRYRLLLDKYLREECTSAEVKELFGLLHEQGLDRMVLNNMQEDFKQAFKTTEPIPEEITGRIWEKLQTSMQPAPVVRVRSPFTTWLKIAAALTGLALSVYLYKQYQAAEVSIQPVVQQEQPQHTDIPPGSNKALLTLANGKQIVLEDAASGLLAREENTTINKEDGDVLVYHAQGTENEKPSFNTISIPRGGHYRVVLPDGSKVWLNAASSLRFPMAFTGGERQVELRGEAYFEVEKDKSKPFIVTVIRDQQSTGVGSNNMKIEVLGTHFNVMAYADETNAVTTLLEGSVKVSATDAGMQTTGSRLLVPGQQAVMNKTAAISVSAGDTEGAIAWKNGYFKFANENISTVMNKIARWYDVDITYKGKLPGKALWGTVSRFEKVSEVLHMLELTGSIHFEVEGRKIIVTELHQ